MTLGIRQAYTIFVLFISICAASISAANADNNGADISEPHAQEQLDSEKIKHIQFISQAILQVRGQQRQQVTEDTLLLLQAVEEVRASLPQMRYRLQEASLQLNPNAYTQEVSITVEGLSWLERFWQEILSLFNNTAQPPTENEKIAVTEMDRQLTSLIQKLEEQGQGVEEELPSLWVFWQKANPEKKAVFEKLTEIIDQLEATQQAVLQEKPEHLQRLEDQLKLPEIVVPDPAPTITTITRHTAQ